MLPSTFGKAIEIDYEPQGYQSAIHESKARYKVVVIGRRGGKTLMAINELIRAAVEDPGPYWFISPTYRQSKQIAWQRLQHLLRPDDDWQFNKFDLSVSHPSIDTRIELKGAENEDSLRGVGIKGLVMDECAIMKKNLWPEILRPMLADSGGWAMFIGTPKGRNWFYDLFSHSGDVWECWRYPTSVNKYIPPEEIENMRRDMPERLFRQEIMAEFLEDESGVFRKIRQCIAGELEGEAKYGARYVMGVDLAKEHDFTVICVMNVFTRHLAHFERFNNIDWTEQKERIQRAANLFNNALCVVDATGVGDPIVEDLMNGGVSVLPFKFNQESKRELVERLTVAIEQRLLTFPNIPTLIEELERFSYEITDRGQIFYGAPEGFFDDCVIGLGLALWGMRTELYPTARFNEQTGLMEFPPKIERRAKMDVVWTHRQRR